MHKARYSFKRSDNIAGSMSFNRPSTDAIKALEEWTFKPDRSYYIREENDDKLVADLTFKDSDEDAGPELDNACEKHGLERTFLQNV